MRLHAWTALHCAAACEAPAQVGKVFFQVHPEVAAEKEWIGRLPLHLAGRNEHLRQVSTHGDGSASQLQVRYRVLAGQTLLQPPSEWNKIQDPEKKLQAHKPKAKILMRYLQMTP